MGTPEKTPPERLLTPVQFLKGVGPQRAELLDRLGLRTVRDVLFFFPRDYQDLTDQRDVDQLEEGKLQSVRGTVDDIELRSTGQRPLRAGRAGPRGRPATSAPSGSTSPSCASGSPSASGCWSPASRSATAWSGRWPIPAWKPWPTTKKSRWARSCPSIRLTEGLAAVADAEDRPRGAGRARRAAWTRSFRRTTCRPTTSGRCGRRCRRSIFPSDRESLDRARRRLVYQELFILQLALAVKRRQQQHDSGRPRRWRPRPRSTPASAGCFPSS